ncbi:MAG: ABC transporter permease [Clostridiales bacterium]|jgi:putative ABC transport system permease protein|nr:ABC transporter permease [Clostridiales bacterium]
MNIFKLVAKNLLRRKGRFVFTLLGITIGMASFVALLSLGGSMRGEVTRQADALGANLIITPKNWCAYDQISILTGNSLPESLQYSVLAEVSAIPGITAVPYLTQTTAVQNRPVSVIGIYPAEMLEFNDWRVREGNYFSSRDVRVLVLGSGIANSFNLNVGDTLTIRGENFPVAAILEENGNNDDTAMYLPLSVVQEIFDVGEYISYIGAKVENIAETESYIAAILDVVNVSVTTDRQLLSTVLSMLGSINVALQLIAGVSLVAAAFGIINTMMTAISERRREIGILRAIGGKSGAIFKIFLLESGLYGFLGGILGVAVGYVVSIFAGPMIAESGMGDLLKGAAPEASINAPIIFAAIFLSVAISVLSGFYPAWKAAKLTPAEAMSYE